jgi:hypothetical protein
MQKQNKRRVHSRGLMSSHVRLPRLPLLRNPAEHKGGAMLEQRGRQDVPRYEGHLVRSCRNKGETYRRLDVRRHGNQQRTFRSGMQKCESASVRLFVPEHERRLSACAVRSRDTSMHILRAIQFPVPAVLF